MLNDYTTVEQRSSTVDMKGYYQALFRAQQEVGNLANDSRGNRGEYVSCEKMLQHCSAALHRNGMIFYPLRATLIEATCEAMSVQGEVTPGTLIWERHFKVVHVETGAWEILTQGFPVPTSKRGMQIDHATAATDSFGLTYFLRGLLSVVRGSDEDTGLGTLVETVATDDVETQAGLDNMLAAVDEAEHIAVTTGQALGAVVPDDHDPSVEELRAYWRLEVPSCEDLAAVPAHEACAAALVKDLYTGAVDSYGHQPVNDAWTKVGVIIRKGQVITGQQARQFVATLALSREPQSSQEELS